jgi:Carboxypeptidase activation peptide
MKWIVGFLAIFTLALCCSTKDVLDAEIIDAAPAEVNTEPAVLFDKDRAGNDPIKYDGAQLWRIAYADQEHKNAVAELQKQFQVSMWNLQMTNNATDPYVDMFVKSAVVSGATEFMMKLHVPFDVVIDDIQNAINNENPSKDDFELWQNRNGEYRHYHRLLMT